MPSSALRNAAIYVVFGAREGAQQGDVVWRLSLMGDLGYSPGPSPQPPRSLCSSLRSVHFGNYEPVCNVKSKVIVKFAGKMDVHQQTFKNVLTMYALCKK